MSYKGPLNIPTTEESRYIGKGEGRRKDILILSMLQPASAEAQASSDQGRRLVGQLRYIVDHEEVLHRIDIYIRNHACSELPSQSTVLQAPPFDSPVW
uniref:Uncharacterized protein n=1 Tax=Trichuris muris TaxID=70415 RepID=A0A5S6R5P3_TRIMR